MQVKQVVVGDPPRLPPGRFSPEFEDFVSQWYGSSLHIIYSISFVKLLRGLVALACKRITYSGLVTANFWNTNFCSAMPDKKRM